MSASTMAMSTVQTLDFGGVQLIRRDVADSIEAIEDNEPATDRVRRGTSCQLGWYLLGFSCFRTGLFGAKIPKLWTKPLLRV